MTADLWLADAHCDTLSVLLEQGGSLWRGKGHLDLERLLASPVRLQFFAVFVDPGYGEERGLRRALQMVQIFRQALRDHADVLKPILWREDVRDFGGERIAAVLSLEGLDILSDTPEILDLFVALGVRSVMLTWNYRNRLAEGALEAGGGLSRLGRTVVQRAEAASLLLDVSHASEQTFWDVLEHTSRPVIASHSNAYAVTPHPRNLRDEQLRAIAQRNGVVGLNFHTPFCTEAPRATIDDLLRHMEHILAVAGEDVLAFGSDLDGIPVLPEGMTDVRSFSVLLEAMAQRWPASTVAKVAGGNLRRLLMDVLPAKGDDGDAV